MTFAYMIYVDVQGRALLCEGGVYTDDAALLDSADEYQGNTPSRAMSDAAYMNAAALKAGFSGRYEVRASAAGIDPIDGNVISSLCAWQRAALGLARP